MNEVKKFVRKPIIVEAIQWTGNVNKKEVEKFVNQDCDAKEYSTAGYEAGVCAPFFSLLIETIQGTKQAIPNDWVVKDAEGELFVYNTAVFESMYERAKKQLKKESVPEFYSIKGVNDRWIEITPDTLPEETEPVLWAVFPINEPPEVGSLTDEGFTHERFTHYRRMTNEFFYLP